MKSIFKLLFLLLLAGCAGNQAIVNNVNEREANEIVVFLASKGIVAQKIAAPTSATAAAAPTDMFSIAVDPSRSTDAMALLNQYGLPRRQGTNLLTLFAKAGLMSSDKEETIRYQAGLAEQLSNTICKIDGVLDANVQLSFPPSDLNPAPGTPLPKVTAAVYVKHQGVMEDPNSHMEVKIKRLLAGSVNGLSYEDVAVISDRSRFADITLQVDGEMIGPKALQQTYVSIWGVILTKSSLARFRTIFFSFIVLLLLFGAAIGYLVYRFYPLLKKREEKTEVPPSETPPPGPNI
ncbi:MAG: EscJ/YscJ/HrcJ family type III secretion inner membrane ring protein [Chlamydiae bacterium CG10_big_fil_rev_8_21_14_0_10_42_34]|nr:MAG: EscJ/YscJ/HrcJ family type III secretion inner membrane ring protein [Chlamydiae bacterium CG10_big_fil_rev_8_21_14_0_10_42_34]